MDAGLGSSTSPSPLGSQPSSETHPAVEGQEGWSLETKV